MSFEETSDFPRVTASCVFPPAAPALRLRSSSQRVAGLSETRRPCGRQRLAGALVCWRPTRRAALMLIPHPNVIFSEEPALRFLLFDSVACFLAVDFSS